MGSGKNGSFDKTPDWQQWGLLAVQKQDIPGLSGNNSKDMYRLYGAFISKWVKFFNCETWTVILEPIEGHGRWDTKKVFGELPQRSAHEGLVAVLTRATIRLSKAKQFWKHVDAVSRQMAGSTGFITSLGIGEIPWIKQATFSIWQNKEDMMNFAYGMTGHVEVIRKTRSEKWYSEDMFTRFKLIGSSGTIKGINPLAGKM